MRLPSPICAVRGAWRTLRAWLVGAVDLDTIAHGCNYVEAEVHRGCWVHVLICRTCGRVSVGWDHGEPPEFVGLSESCCAAHDPRAAADPTARHRGATRVMDGGNGRCELSEDDE